MEITSAAHQTAPRGGQASLGLFGVRGLDAPRQPLPRTPRPSRIKGALNSFSSDGLSAAHYHRPAAPVAMVRVSNATPVRPPSLDDEPQLAHSQWLADLAESYGCPFDEEAAAYAGSFAGVGMAEHLMAMEG